MWLELLPAYIGSLASLVLAIVAVRDSRRARRNAHRAINIASADRLRQQMDARRYGRRKDD